MLISLKGEVVKILHQSLHRDPLWEITWILVIEILAYFNPLCCKTFQLKSCRGLRLVQQLQIFAVLVTLDDLFTNLFLTISTISLKRDIFCLSRSTLMTDRVCFCCCSSSFNLLPFLNGPFPDSFSLFVSFQYSWQ